MVSITVHLKLDQTADDSNDNGDNSGGNSNVPPGFPQLPGFRPASPSAPRPSSRKRSRPRVGFIINSNGTIVTNNHVVKGAQSVSVTLSDGTSYPAKVIGTDPKTDLAVVKITVGHPLPYVELGQSRGCRAG